MKTISHPCLPDFPLVLPVSLKMTKCHQPHFHGNHCRADTSLCQLPCLQQIDKGRFGLTAEEGTRRVVTGNTLWQLHSWRAGGENGELGGGWMLHCKNHHRETCSLWRDDGWLNKEDRTQRAHCHLAGPYAKTGWQWPQQSGMGCQVQMGFFVIQLRQC